MATDSKQIKKNRSQHGTKKTGYPSPAGMRDILPREESWWRAVYDAGSSVATLHDFSFLETPVVESEELLGAEFGIGGGRGEAAFYLVRGKRERLALRGETAVGTMRSFFEHHLGYAASPLKVWVLGQVFHLTPPHGSERKMVHELAFHLIGDSDAVYDMEAILASLEVLRELGFREVKLNVNTMGCRVCRPHYRDKLRSYYQGRRQKLCRRCTGLLDRYPLRLLSCSVEGCRAVRTEAPIILDYSCQNCNNHFKTVLELIEDNGVIYEPNPYLIGDTDYFARTVFEITVPSFSGVLARGGRYDYLGEVMHGRVVPAVLSTIVVEEVIDAMRSAQLTPRAKEHPRAFFIAVGEQAKKTSVRLMADLRKGNVTVLEAVGKKSLKSQLRIAEKTQAPVAILFGQKEAFEGSAIIRDMRTGAQETVVVGRLAEEVKKRLKQ